MPGTHVVAPHRAPWRRRDARRGGAPGVGWWRPPPRTTRGGGRAPRPAVDDERAARHRAVVDPAEAPTAAIDPVTDPVIGSMTNSMTGSTIDSAAPSALRRTRFARTRRAAVLLTAFTVLGPLAALTPGYLLIAAPGPDDVVRGTAALISYADGSDLARLAPEPSARPEPRRAQVPGQVRDAVLAAQDPDYASRPLIDPDALFRAVAAPDRSPAPAPGHPAEPVANQFVGGALAGFAPTAWRRYRELVLVSKLAVQRDHDELLADYLDTVYLGRGAYGLAAGAQDYFGKDVGGLTLEEGALLAALIGAPWAVDQTGDPAAAQQHWARVLDAMVTDGRLTPERRAAATFPATLPRRPDAGLPDDDRAHTVAAVIAELHGLGFDEQQLASGGLRVVTTLDRAREKRASVAAARVREQLGSRFVGDPPAVAVVALDPATGGVLAYHGGPDGRGQDAARTARSAGSLMDPFVLLAGRLQDPPVGPDALGCDDRCPAAAMIARLAGRVGPDAVAAAAGAAGIDVPVPAGGTAATGVAAPGGVDAWQLAAGYSTLAAGGVHRTVHLVESVGTADGRLLYRAGTDGERRVPEADARAALPADTETATQVGGASWVAGVGPGMVAVVTVAEPAGPVAPGRGRPVPAGAEPARRVWAELTAG